MRTLFNNIVLSGALLVVGMNANAGVILSTDFDGRTVAGATASDLTWVTDGLSDPGALTAVGVDDAIVSPPAVTLFDTTAAQDRFAVKRNIAASGSRAQGNWQVTVPLNVDGKQIMLRTVSLDALILNNSGALQGAGRELDLSAQVVGATGDPVRSANNVFAFANGAGSANPNPRPVSFNFNALILETDTNYSLVLKASSNASNGNNAGIDNLVLTGDVPAPATLALLALGLLGIRMRSR